MVTTQSNQKKMKTSVILFVILFITGCVGTIEDTKKVNKSVEQQAVEITFAGALTCKAISHDKVDISFKAASVSRGSTAANDLVYEAYVNGNFAQPRANGFASAMELDTSGNYHLIVDSLDLAQTYSFSVRAFDPTTSIYDSNNVRCIAQTLSDYLPDFFGLKKAEEVPGLFDSVLLSWQEAKPAAEKINTLTGKGQTGYKIKKYIVYYTDRAPDANLILNESDQDHGGQRVIDAFDGSSDAVTSLIVDQLTPGTTYYFIVRAQDEDASADLPGDIARSDLNTVIKSIKVPTPKPLDFAGITDVFVPKSIAGYSTLSAHWTQADGEFDYYQIYAVPIEDHTDPANITTLPGNVVTSITNPNDAAFTATYNGVVAKVSNTFLLESFVSGLSQKQRHRVFVLACQDDLPADCKVNKGGNKFVDTSTKTITIPQLAIFSGITEVAPVNANNFNQLKIKFNPVPSTSGVCSGIHIVDVDTANNTLSRKIRPCTLDNDPNHICYLGSTLDCDMGEVIVDNVKPFDDSNPNSPDPINYCFKARIYHDYNPTPGADPYDGEAARFNPSGPIVDITTDLEELDGRDYRRIAIYPSGDGSCGSFSINQPEFDLDYLTVPPNNEQPSGGQLTMNWTLPKILADGTRGHYQGYVVGYKKGGVPSPSLWSSGLEDIVKNAEDPFACLTDSNKYCYEVFLSPTKLSHTLTGLSPAADYTISVRTIMQVPKPGLPGEYFFFFDKNKFQTTITVKDIKLRFRGWEQIYAVGPRVDGLFDDLTDAKKTLINLEDAHVGPTIKKTATYYRDTDTHLNGTLQNFDVFIPNNGLQFETMAHRKVGSLETFFPKVVSLDRGDNTVSPIIEQNNLSSNGGIVMLGWTDMAVVMPITSQDADHLHKQSFISDTSGEDPNMPNGYYVFRNDRFLEQGEDPTKDESFQRVFNDIEGTNPNNPNQTWKILNPGKPIQLNANDKRYYFVDYINDLHPIHDTNNPESFALKSKRGKLVYYTVRYYYNGKFLNLDTKDITGQTANRDSVVDIIIPPANMALVHRWSANKMTCDRLAKSSEIDYQNDYRCSYSGQGQIEDPSNNSGQTYYDTLGHLLVDRFQLGCNVTRFFDGDTYDTANRGTKECTGNTIINGAQTGDCIGDGQNLSIVSGSKGNSVFYDTTSKGCYINAGVDGGGDNQWVLLEELYKKHLDPSNPLYGGTNLGAQNIEVPSITVFPSKLFDSTTYYPDEYQTKPADPSTMIGKGNQYTSNDSNLPAVTGLTSSQSHFICQSHIVKVESKGEALPLNMRKRLLSNREVIVANVPTQNTKDNWTTGNRYPKGKFDGKCYNALQNEYSGATFNKNLISGRYIKSGNPYTPFSTGGYDLKGMIRQDDTIEFPLVEHDPLDPLSILDYTKYKDSFYRIQQDLIHNAPVDSLDYKMITSTEECVSAYGMQNPVGQNFFLSDQSLCQVKENILDSTEKQVICHTHPNKGSFKTQWGNQNLVTQMGDYSKYKYNNSDKLRFPFYGPYSFVDSLTYSQNPLNNGNSFSYPMSEKLSTAIDSTNGQQIYDSDLLGAPRGTSRTNFDCYSWNGGDNPYEISLCVGNGRKRRYLPYALYRFSFVNGQILNCNGPNQSCTPDETSLTYGNLFATPLTSKQFGLTNFGSLFDDFGITGSYGTKIDPLGDLYSDIFPFNSAPPLSTQFPDLYPMALLYDQRQEIDNTYSNYGIYTPFSLYKAGKFLRVDDTSVNIDTEVDRPTVSNVTGETATSWVNLNKKNAYTGVRCAVKVRINNKGNILDVDNSRLYSGKLQVNGTLNSGTEVGNSLYDYFNSLIGN